MSIGSYLVGVATLPAAALVAVAAAKAAVRVRRLARAGKCPAPMRWANYPWVQQRLVGRGWTTDFHGVGVGRFGVGVMVGRRLTDDERARGRVPAGPVPSPAAPDDADVRVADEPDGP